MNPLCYLCLVFVMLLRLFIGALWVHGAKLDLSSDVDQDT